MRKLFYFFILLLFIACARMGRPDGGWYDDDPPIVIGSTPADKSTNVTTKKITIYFDEFVKLEDATNKVIISPPQLEMPDIKSGGKKIVVELKDTLKENTTYTIDFSDAISDNNEGNPWATIPSPSRQVSRSIPSKWRATCWTPATWNPSRALP